MKLSLVVLTPGKGEGKVIPITLSQFLIGRDPQCHLRPASAMISKRHCALMVKGEKVFLRDFDSTNGTFLNDRQVKGEVELRHDDQIKVGPLVFRVDLTAQPAVDQATPLPPTKSKTPPPASKAPARPTATPKDETATTAVAKTETAPAAKADAPAKTGSPAKTGGEDDDSIAAMLLLLGDDGSAGGEAQGEGGVPEGSTVFDMPAVNPQEPGAEGGETKPPAGGEKKDDKKAASKGDTSNAAKAILEKYMRRPRG